MIFDGLATVYSTCRRCNTLMRVFEADETVHPTCEPKPTKLESLTIGYSKALEYGDDKTAELTAAEINKHLKTPPDLRRAAVWYAKWGWPVFPLRPVGTRCEGGDKCKPLCQCPKTPATRNGFKDARTDLKIVNRWWSQSPACNIGLATGCLFDVIDVDPRHGGVMSLMKLLEQQLIPEVHGIAATASGGMHLYVKPVAIRTIATGVRPGIDYRGKGGYVCAPPSTLGAPGRSWSWLTVPSPQIKARQHE